MSKNQTEKSDFEVCKYKIRALLKEYNCELTDPDEGHWVLITDLDTGETSNVYN